MKKALFFCFLTAAALACTKIDQNVAVQGGNQSPEIIPAVNLKDSVSQKAFDYLNLDYPGLEKVKEHYEKAKAGSDKEEIHSEYYLAAYELLEYFRARPFNMPDYNFMNPYATDGDLNKADQAIEHRFYIKNFEDGTTPEGQPQFYKFPFIKDKSGKDTKRIDWTFTPKNLVASSSEFGYQKFRQQWILPQAKAYAMTGDEKYMDSWKEVYGDFMKQYPCPEGTISGKKEENLNVTIWKDLQVAARTQEQPAIMKYFIGSAGFTPGWLTQVLATYAEGVESIIANPYPDKTNNIYFALVQAVATATCCFPEFARSPEWQTYATSQISEQITTQFREDGVHNDLDPSYHLGVVANFISTYKLAAANGKSSIFPESEVKQLKNACKFILDIVYPDYSLEYFNDTRRNSKNVLKRNLKLYSEIFPENEGFLWMGSEHKAGKAPDYRLAIYDKGGYYMLRNGWEEDATMLILKNNFNQSDKWHCQPDNGTIGLYSKGRSFLPDAGVFSYEGTKEDNANREIYASTDMHNTLTSNGATIEKGRTLGKFLKSGETPEYSYVVTSNDSYEGMSHRRAVFFVDNSFFVILDEGYGNKEHKARIGFRFCETKNDFVEDAYEGKGSYGSHSIFTDGNNMIFKTFAETTEGWTAKMGTKYYSPEIGEKIQRPFYDVQIGKAADKAARFITVIHPLGSASEFSGMEIGAKFTDNAPEAAGTFHENGASAEVTVNGKTYNLTYSLN